jgi:hypothetical protein
MNDPRNIANLIQEDIRFNNGLICDEIQLPKVKQTETFDCGAAALRAISQYFGVGPESEEEFIQICDSGERKGTHPSDLVDAAGRLGLRAEIYQEMPPEKLFELLDQGIPVICAIQAWGKEEDYRKSESGHYVVVVGHDDEKVYFEDPSLKTSSRGFLPVDEFISRWHDIEFGEKEPEVRLGIAVWSDGGPVEVETPKDGPKEVE